VAEVECIEVEEVGVWGFSFIPRDGFIRALVLPRHHLHLSQHPVYILPDHPPFALDYELAIKLKAAI
jgi:hypothetical protein